MNTLILLRHGESTGNSGGCFTGWMDVPLTDNGRAEAARSGELLGSAGLLPDVLHTSVLRRAINTAAVMSDACDRHWIPTHRSWRLNERHYGSLQGESKKAICQTFGEKQFATWRRSYTAAPPPMPIAEFEAQAQDPRYAEVPPALMPQTESLAQVSARLLPYWTDVIAPEVRTGRTACVVAHGNSLRALIKHLDEMSDEAFTRLNIPTGIPLIYELNDDLRPTTPGGVYLDPGSAATAIASIAAEGR